jgi:hypothetical protein
MNHIIFWNKSAHTTYFNELDFIFLKWNEKEVFKFEELVEIEINRLKINPFIGIYNENLGIYSLVISKQTTLYYRLDKVTNNVELIVFWNNQKNPKDLMKLL